MPDCSAVLGLFGSCRTHCAPCGRCVQTTARSQWLRRAVARCRKALRSSTPPTGPKSECDKCASRSHDGAAPLPRTDSLREGWLRQGRGLGRGAPAPSFSHAKRRRAEHDAKRGAAGVGSWAPWASARSAGLFGRRAAPSTTDFVALFERSARRARSEFDTSEKTEHHSAPLAFGEGRCRRVPLSLLTFFRGSERK